MESQLKTRFETLWPLFMIPLFVVSFPLKYDIVGITFFISAIISTIMLMTTLAGYASILMIFFLFSLTFLTLIPWLHYSTNILIWRLQAFRQEVYININSLVIFSNLIVFFVHKRCYRKIKRRNPKYFSQGPLSIPTLVTFSLVGFLGVLYINDFSLSALLLRGGLNVSRNAMIDSSSISLVLSSTTRLIPAFCFYYAISNLSGHRSVKVFLFLVMFLGAFPTGIPRYLVGFIYVPVIMIIFSSIRRSSLLGGIISLSLLVVFPLLDQFRRFSSFSDISILPRQEFFYAAHFDAYENFASAFESQFVTNGRQLLGVLLFFIPRDIWNDKPVGSGYELASQSGYTFWNISMPFLAEGYVNFGIIGVLAFALLAGFGMGKLDAMFSHHGIMLGRVSYSACVFFFLIGAAFFMFRGDLLSSFAYVIAGLLVAGMVNYVMILVNNLSARAS